MNDVSDPSMNGAAVNGTALNGSSVVPTQQLAQDLGASERARLMAEIAAANDRTAAARARTTQIQAEVQADLRIELEASRAILEAMEREHSLALAAIRDEAQAEVDRILTAARQQAAAPADVGIHHA